MLISFVNFLGLLLKKFSLKLLIKKKISDLLAGINMQHNSFLPDPLLNTLRVLISFFFFFFYLALWFINTAGKHAILIFRSVFTENPIYQRVCFLSQN